jgi:hypothetical protein
MFAIIIQTTDSVNVVILLDTFLLHITGNGTRAIAVRLRAKLIDIVDAKCFVAEAFWNVECALA